MDYRTALRMQRNLYINVYMYASWIFVIGIFLFMRVNMLGHLTKYLAMTVFALVAAIEGARLYFGYFGNVSCRVPEMAGFVMLTAMMQLPLISFFLFNPYLLSTPMEITLHALLWFMNCVEIVLGFLALKQASSFAKSVYLSHPKR
ncbi:transmembrane protein 17-like isoform X1 [Hyposmocoma kahamanoa]|uniref:transmembrane protein 17-like isoform X1 n=1 Tax=Hyposmocoma kahamanoa TaxID=1477025 RepID=UPI000E6D7F47|nr:transmembrane protein 17-like isoform X1 [Hyposmocoma kahamanoa]